MLQEQYIELSTSIAGDSSLFGAQERTASKGLSLQRTAIPLPMWNHDTLSANADTNLYGSHPFILEVRPGTPLHSTAQSTVRFGHTLLFQAHPAGTLAGWMQALCYTVRCQDRVVAKERGIPGWTALRCDA